jgi:hypothetical protein
MNGNFSQTVKYTGCKLIVVWKSKFFYMEIKICLFKRLSWKIGLCISTEDSKQIAVREALRKNSWNEKRFGKAKIWLTRNTSERSLTDFNETLLYYRECYKKQLKNKFSCHRQYYKHLLIKVVTNMISSEKVFKAKRFITPTANNEGNWVTE